MRARKRGVWKRRAAAALANCALKNNKASGAVTKALFETLEVNPDNTLKRVSAGRLLLHLGGELKQC